MYNWITLLYSRNCIIFVNQSTINKIFKEEIFQYFWPPDVKSRLIGKDLDAGKDWGQEKRVTENEMVGWHYWLNGHESKHDFEQTPGDGEGQETWRAAAVGLQRVGYHWATNNNKYSLYHCSWWQQGNGKPRGNLFLMCSSRDDGTKLNICIVSILPTPSEPITCILVQMIEVLRDWFKQGQSAIQEHRLILIQDLSNQQVWMLHHWTTSFRQPASDHLWKHCCANTISK